MERNPKPIPAPVKEKDTTPVIVRKPKDRSVVSGFKQYKPHMKLIFFMALVVSNETRSGSIGDTVYSRNTYGNYVRQRTKPVYPATELQMAVAAAFGSQSQVWRTLTSAERAGWAAMAATVSFTNRLGQSIFLKGQAMFNKLNTTLISAGQAQITVAPAYTVPAAPLSVTGTAAAAVPALSIAYTPTPVAAGTVLQLWMTPQMSPGITFNKSAYRLIRNIAAGVASPFNALAPYNTQFGALVEGQAIHVQIRSVDIATGVHSPAIKDIIIVAA